MIKVGRRGSLNGEIIVNGIQGHAWKKYETQLMGFLKSIRVNKPLDKALIIPTVKFSNNLNRCWK